MTRHSKSQFGCLCILLILVATAQYCAAQTTQPATTAPAVPRSGTITYPAIDNLDLREGTIECWVKLLFDPTEGLPQKEYKGLAVLWAVSGENGAFNTHYYAPANATTPMWWCSIGPKSLFTPFAIKEIVMSKDEWHHVALSWKGDTMTAYFDGKKSGAPLAFHSSIYKGFGGVSKEKPILIGDRWNLASRLVIDDFRLSRIERKPEELGFAGALKPDAFTAILDPFEGDFVPDGKQLTKPSQMLAGGGGTPSAGCGFVEGKFGKGMSLFVLPEQK